jgi:Ran GTPase-activating protein (RanGAP) involved in mRNA processing and transport
MNTTVTALWLKRNPLLPQGAKYLASALTTNTALQTLDLVNTGILDEGVISVIQALQQNPASSLQHLYIGGNAETAKSGEAIGNWLKTGYSRLTSLFLSCSRLEDEGVKFIAEGLKVDKLINRIGLESVRVGDEGAKALADALEHHPSITLLDLGFRKGTFEMGERPNQITDEGLLYIGEKLIGPPDARKVNNLRILDFVSNKITREGAQKFVETYVRGNEQLLRVRLSQTGAERNISVEHECKQLARENQKKFFEPSLPLSEEEKQERLRVKEVMEPNHISEIYSIYRGKLFKRMNCEYQILNT